MIDVVSVKFKNRGKSYYFDPNGLTVSEGQKVIVETSKGLEIADCFRANHPVEETAVVQPLRPIVRIATSEDLRVEEISKRSEKEAFAICEKKIAEHGLDMKLIDVECSFDGTKTTFFFTSEGRVDFRGLVKDLAGIFRNRIELRQIGVRDEAKMVGGLGICGRPYCCSQFLDDFQPVSTKMAKVQGLSLNPTKISGSCGRLMCCLRYEQEAYEDLSKKVPRQGSFVETKDGYGTAVQVNLLRQTIKVRLDGDTDDSLHLYKSNELAQVPGGRPKDGENPPKVFTYVPEEETSEETAAETWQAPQVRSTEWDTPADTGAPASAAPAPNGNHEVARVKVEARPARRDAKPAQSAGKAAQPSEKTGRDNNRRSSGDRNSRRNRGEKKEQTSENRPAQNAAKKQPAEKAAGAKSENTAAAKPEGEGDPSSTAQIRKKNNYRRRYYHHSKPKSSGGQQQQ